MGKSGTYSEFSNPCKFYCDGCKEFKTEFKTRWKYGYHASGDEDQQYFYCLNCECIMYPEEYSDETS